MGSSLRNLAVSNRHENRGSVGAGSVTSVGIRNRLALWVTVLVDVANFLSGFVVAINVNSLLGDDNCCGSASNATGVYAGGGKGQGDGGGDFEVCFFHDGILFEVW